MIWPGFLERGEKKEQRTKLKVARKKKSKKLIRQENVSQLGENLVLQK